jgi:hypothetical protein
MNFKQKMDAQEMAQFDRFLAFGAKQTRELLMRCVHHPIPVSVKDALAITYLRGCGHGYDAAQYELKRNSEKENNRF